MSKKTKDILVMRHGQQQETNEPAEGFWQKSAPLSIDGNNTIAWVAAHFFPRVKFQIIGSSPLTRAKETSYIVADVVADGGEVNIFDTLGPLEKSWDLLYSRDPNLADVSNTELYESSGGGPLLVAEGDKLFRCIQKIAGLLTIGQKAILISHQPLIEYALSAATNIWPPEIELRKGEMISLSFNRDNEFIRWKYIPHPL